MRPGIFARTFANGSLSTSLDRVVASGISAIQFNLALAGGPSLPHDVPPSVAGRVRDALRARRLQMVAVSGTYNMAHPDHAVRERGANALGAMIAAAPMLDTKVVTLCTGTRDPKDMWRWHEENATPQAWADMLASIRAAIVLAEQHDVVLAFEPEHNNIVSDARDGRRLLDEIGSPQLKVVIDAANLIRPGELDRQAHTLEHAFELLGRDIVLAHAKDVLDDGTVVPAGRGALDYARYVSLLREAAYAGALVLHGLGPEDVEESLAFLRAHLREPLADVG